MAFQPRSFPQILADMIAYVQANTVISDFNVGSVARTLLEAAALEDDEQYFQMVQLLEAFRITTARGEDLDRRLADFGINRREATASTVPVRFFNRNLISQRVATLVTSGSTSIQVFDSSIFPATGFPYTIRVGEGTVRIQDFTVTANNTSTNILTVSSPALTDMLVGDRVSLVTGAGSYTIPAGTSVQAAPTASQPAKVFRTTEPAFIVQGNFFSSEVRAVAQVTGTTSNVGAQRISQFTGSPPFNGAGVTNLSGASGGLARESDDEFRERALRILQSLSRGTPLALQTASINVVDPTTQQRSVSANVVEDFVDDEVFVYIDDGTGLVPSSISLPLDNISGGAASIGDGVLVLADTSAFPSSGSILILEDSLSNPAEFVGYTANDVTTNTLTLASILTQNHANGTTVLVVDLIEDDAESGRRRFKLQNKPIVRGTDRIFIDPGTGIYELTPDVDYVLNRGVGELQLVDLSGAPAGAELYGSYTYYTGLIREVQRVLEGDLDNTVDYPGVKAAGIFLSVEAPTIKRITVIASISARPGFNEEDLKSLVQEQIEGYISSRRLGDDVILSKIVDVAHNVAGVADVIISTPTSNVTVLENELPVPFDSAGDSLVTIL